MSGNVIPRVYPDDPNLRPQTLAHHVARYKFAAEHFCDRDFFVLDLMCGSGYGTEIIRQTGCDVVGVDEDVEAIKYARSAYPLCPFFVSRAQDVRMPFLDGIVWFEGIEHVERHDAIAVLAQCANSLPPGGTMLISTPRDTNEKYNPWHLSKWPLTDLLEHTRHFSSVTAWGQDWDTAAITREHVEANDFYILVCRK
jgi:2-polyprenyl-3-methyl-5-hydroxy-6-metoxy-1,4-benzoquinol methylase